MRISIVSQERESGTRQERDSGTRQERESGTRPEIIPRLRAATRLRIVALGGFEPSQARPQQAPLDGAALVALVGLVPACLQGQAT